MYGWKEGSVHRVKPEIAGQELERIAAAYGPVTAAIVVDESRPTDAPLHPEFDWDDAFAAQQWRENQARCIIRSIVVKTSEQDNKPPMRVFVHVNIGDDRESCYVRTVDALSDKDLRRQVLERALKELDGWRRRYAELEDLALVFESADIVRQRALQLVEATV